MNNIYVEGIQGAGKSTLVNRLAQAHPNLHVCREGDYSPVELAWCTWMTEEEYQAVLTRYAPIREEIEKNTYKEQEHYIITYTRVLTDIPGFHKDLEQYEIYNGRRSLQEFKEIIFSRQELFQESFHFGQELDEGYGYLFECSFFQNVMETLILYYMLSDEEIVEFYREFYGHVDKEHFRLLYLFSEDLEENIRAVRKERCDGFGNEWWYELLLRYLIHSPYGQEHHYSGFEDMIAHFRHRQDLEMRIIREVVGEKAKILTSKGYSLEEWDMKDWEQICF